jgi:hypothetical protein
MACVPEWDSGVLIFSFLNVGEAVMSVNLPDLVAITGVISLPGHNPAESHVHLTYIDRHNKRTALRIPFLAAMQLLQELELIRSSNGFELPKR